MTDIVELGFKADTSGILKTDSALNKLGNTSDRTAGRLDSDVKRVNSTFTSLNKTLLAVGGTLAALGAANALGGLVSTNREFGQSVADLSAITGAAGEDLAFYVEQAKEIGRTTSLSASQASEAFKLIASAKPDLLDSAEALTAVTEEAVTLAEAAGILLPESARALGSALNQFQLDASQANEAINILAASSKLGAAEIPLVTEALKNAGSAANALDVDLAETVAGIQALAKAGIVGAEAGTALRQVLLRLERTADAELQPSIVGLDAAIAELSERQMSTVELMKLFGDEAFSSATAILAQQETLAELNVTLRDTDTATEQAAIRMNTLNGDILALNSAFEGLQIELFDLQDGLARDLVQGLTDGVNELTGNIESLTNAGIAFAAVYGGVAVAALGKKTAASVADTLATRAALKADLDKAVSAQAVAAAEFNDAKAKAAKSTSSIFAKSAVQALTLAESKHVAALTAVDVAQKRVAASANLMGAATRFALGPWGLLITALGVAAIAFNNTESEIDELTKTQNDYNDSLDETITLLDLFNQKQESQTRSELQGLGSEELQAELDRATKALEVYENRLERFKDQNASAARVAELENKIRDQKVIIDEVNKLLPNAKTSYEKLTESILKLGEELNPLAKATREYEEDLALLNEAKAKGVEIIGGYDSALSLLKNRYDEIKAKISGVTEETDKFAEESQRLIDRLDPLSALTRGYTRDGLVLFGLRQKQIITEEEYIKLTGNLADEFKKQKDSITGVTKEQQEFASLQNEIASGADRIGTAFQTTGNGIIDTFGEAITVLSDFGNEMSRITELQIKLDEEKAKGVDVTKEQAMLNEQMVSAQLSGIGSLLGASANLFDEQSKEREALHRAEVAFAAVEIALAAKKAFANAQTAITSAFSAPFPLNFAAGAAMIGIMSALLGTSFNGGSGGVQLSTGTGTTLGDDSAQSQSINNSFESLDIQTEQLAELKGINDSMSGLVGAINQLTVDVLSAGGLDTGFVTGLGGSGGFDSGGLSGPLGAAAVGAGVAAFTGGAALLSGGLSLVATGILDALTGGFVSDLLDGIIGGLFGSSESFIEDSGIQVLSQTIDDIVNSGDVLAQTFAVVRTESESLFGLISSTSTDTQFGDIDSEFTQGLADIFSFMTDSLLEVGDVLDLAFVHFADGAVMTLEESLSEFTIPELNISFEGKTGEEIEQELQAIIGAVGDDLADFLFPSLREYQQINEGMYETVIRVAQETVIFTDAMEKLGVNMENMAYLADIEFGQAVIEASGGLEEFTSAFNEFYDIYFTDLEKSINLGASLSDIFKQLNIRMPTTNDEFRDLVEETAAMGEEGAETLAVLLDISPAMAEYNEQLQEQLDILQRSLEGFADINTFMKRIPDEIIPNVGGLDRATTDMLIEQFGSSGAFISAVEDFANMFLSESDAFAVSTASMSASFEGLSSILDNADIPDNTETLNEELNAMNMAIRFGTSSAGELRNDFGNLFNEMSTFDVESGVLSGLLAIAPAMNEYISLLEAQEQATQAALEAEQALQEERDNRTLDLQVELLRAQGSELEAVAIERAREIELLQEYDAENQTNLANIQSLIYLQEDYNDALEESKDALSSVFDNLNLAVDAQRESILGTISELENASERLEAAINQIDVNIRGDSFLAQRELEDVLAQARQGDFSGVSGLDFATLTSNDTSQFSTLQEFNLEQARTASQLEELKELTDAQITDEQLILETLESSLDIAKQQYDALMDIDENQVQQLIDNEQYAEATDLAFAEFLNALVNTNGLVALQEDNDEERFQEFLEVQQSLIDSGVVNTSTLVDVISQSDGLLTELQDILTATGSDLVDAQNHNADEILNLADLQQSLIDANILNFESLINLTDEQGQQIIDNLNDLTASTSNLDVDIAAGINTSNLFLSAIAGTLLSIEQSMGGTIWSRSDVNRVLGHAADIDYNTNRTSKILNHAADIDFNTHMTATRLRILMESASKSNEELGKIRFLMQAQVSTSQIQGKSIDENTKSIERIVQKIELNGIRVRA